jgi:transglutaminase-like putative cysteine protease
VRLAKNQAEEAMENIGSEYLHPTPIIDSDHPNIVEFAGKTVSGVDNDPGGQVVKLFYAVRDGIWYDPYYPFYLPEHYRCAPLGGRAGSPPGWGLPPSETTWLPNS